MLEPSPKQKWIVACTGASGMCYALRLIELLAPQVSEVHVIFSDAALSVLAEEEKIKVSQSRLRCEILLGTEYGNVKFFNPRDIGAAPASGSVLYAGMVIVPCSMATLGAVAHGIGQNLIHRAADVTLKEGRQLILVPRETPLSAIHLENMLTLSKAGAAIVPAMPGFYHRPQTIAELIDMLVMKIMDRMGLHMDLVERWAGRESAGPRLAAVGNGKSS